MVRSLWKWLISASRAYEITSVRCSTSGNCDDSILPSAANFSHSLRFWRAPYNNQTERYSRDSWGSLSLQICNTLPMDKQFLPFHFRVLWGSYCLQSCSTLDMKALQYAKMSGTSHPVTQRHNPDGFNHLKLFITIPSYHMKQQADRQTPNILTVWQTNVPQQDAWPTTAKHLRSTLVHVTLRDTSSSACGRSPAEIVGSNPTGGMDICLLWVSCVVR